jgi:pimeloyl-ACP methyl ester carboxylesterase
METEFAWRIGADEPYGPRLARELGVPPVFVRYNTGRHISENGRCLADLLEALVANWPIDVAEVALVGHSMGGLVSRSAAHQAKADGMAWSRRSAT